MPMEKVDRIRPSLLSADFLHLKREMDHLVRLPIKMLHFDVMDGNFVERISFGENLYDTLSKAYGKKIGFDVHLMVQDWERHVRLFYQLGCRTITIHYEAVSSMNKVEKIRKAYPDLSLGLAFNPETDVSRVLGLYSLFDSFLVMSVHPGMGGQPFIPSSLEKIERLDDFRRSNRVGFRIAVDGGIDPTTGPLCLQKGADSLVCGSAFFKAEDREAFLAAFQEGGKR